MLAPIFNDQFTELLETNYLGGDDNDSAILARLINSSATRTDEVSSHLRPSLNSIISTANHFGVLPCEIFRKIVNDVIYGEAGSSEDFLLELLDWIIHTNQSDLFTVLSGYAAHQKSYSEWKRAVADQHSPPEFDDKYFQQMLDDIASIHETSDHKENSPLGPFY